MCFLAQTFKERVTYMKIRTMLILSTTIFSLFSMTLFAIVVSVFLSSSAEEGYMETLREMSVKQSGTLEMYFDSYKQKLTTISVNPAIVDYIAMLEDPDASDEDANVLAAAGERALRALEALSHEGSNVTGITIFNNDTIAPVVIASGADRIGFLLHHRKDMLGPDRFAAIPIQDSATEQYYELFIYTPISDSHYLLCSFSSDDLTEFFVRSRPSPGGRILRICPLNHLLDQTFRGNIEESANRTTEYIRIYSNIRPEADIKHRNGTEFFTYEVGKVFSYALFNSVGDTGWMLGVIGVAKDKSDIASNALSRLINLAIFLGLFMAAFNIFFAIRLTKPLITIKDTLFKVRRGDHDIRINITQNNEYGKVSKEFNDLLDNVVVGENRYKTVVEMSDNIIFEWNFHTDEVVFSNNFSKKFSYRAPTDSYKDSFLVKCKVHPEDTENYRKTLDKLSKGEAIQQDEFRWKNIFGDYVWVLMRAGAIHGANGEIMKVVGVIIDIDRAKKSEKILSARASYDALTGLYNRETLEELINNEIQLIAARKNEFAILFIDVDDFKFFNDNYSHATGDQVLRFTAISINDIVSKYGMAGRFGGDEFVVCIRNSEINDPAKTAEAILDKLKDGFVCDVGDRLTVNVSIGIAIIKDTAKRVEEIIGMADDAMYKIKNSGKSNYGFIN